MGTTLDGVEQGPGGGTESLEDEREGLAAGVADTVDPHAVEPLQTGHVHVQQFEAWCNLRKGRHFIYISCYHIIPFSEH